MRASYIKSFCFLRRICCPNSNAASPPKFTGATSTLRGGGTCGCRRGGEEAEVEVEVCERTCAEAASAGSTSIRNNNGGFTNHEIFIFDRLGKRFVNMAIPLPTWTLENGRRNLTLMHKQCASLINLRAPPDVQVAKAPSKQACSTATRSHD